MTSWSLPPFRYVTSVEVPALPERTWAALTTDDNAVAPICVLAVCSAAHACLRLGEGGLELLCAATVNLRGRLLDRVGECRVHRLGFCAVVDGHDASRARG